MTSLYCNALLAGLPSNTIKPLQMIQNAAARLVFNEPKEPCYTSFISLHWRPVAARIQFKTLMLAYRTTTSGPTYFHSLLRIYIPSRSWDLLVSDASWYHHREAQNHSPEHSLHRSWLVEWSSHPPSGMLDPCQPSSNNWKLISFNYLTSSSSKKKKKLFLNLHLSLSFSLSLASLYLFEQCLRLGVRGTSSVCLPLQDNRFMYSPIVNRFG